MRKKRRRKIIFCILVIIIAIIGFVFYQKGLINKLNSADVDYKLSYQLVDSDSIIITLDRERHSGNFKELYFGIIDNNMANVTKIDDKNFNSLEYKFNEKMSLQNYGLKNNMGMIKLEYNFNNINELSNSYNIFHVALLGNNNKNQYYMVIYYLNNEDKLTLKILNTDEIYNYSVLSSLVEQLNKNLNLNMTVADLSNQLVSNRETIKQNILK